MSRAPMNRRGRRNQAKELKALGIDPDLMFVRYDITPDALASLDEPREDGKTPTKSDLVMVHLQEAVKSLEAEGGDVWKRTVITLGEHPRNPGGISVEVKTYPVGHAG